TLPADPEAPFAPSQMIPADKSSSRSGRIAAVFRPRSFGLPAERTSSAAAAALSDDEHSVTRIAAAVCCRGLFGSALVFGLEINVDDQLQTAVSDRRKNLWTQSLLAIPPLCDQVAAKVTVKTGVSSFHTAKSLV